MRVCYSPGYYAPVPQGHVFPMGKFEGLHARLLQLGVVRDHEVVEPSMCDFEVIERIHTPRYARAVWTGTLSTREVRRLGLPWSRGLGVRSRLAVQGTILAGRMALEDGVAGNLAGGTHHAMPDRGEGFCVYNDVAIACMDLRAGGFDGNILVLDCDVHQGNGTAHILTGRPGIYTASVHGERNYPFHKPPSTLDVGLPDGTGDRAYINSLEDALTRIASEFRPELVFYLAGIDPLAEDRFGRLSLTGKGLLERERTVLRWCAEQGSAVAILLSGGYAPTLSETVEAHSLVFRTALDLGLQTRPRHSHRPIP